MNDFIALLLIIFLFYGGYYLITFRKYSNKLSRMSSVPDQVEQWREKRIKKKNEDKKLQEIKHFESIKWEFIEFVENNFNINECNHCLEVDYYPKMINTLGTKLKLQCNQCGNSKVFSLIGKQDDGKKGYYNRLLTELHEIHIKFFPNYKDRDNHWFMKLSKPTFRELNKREGIPKQIRDDVWNRDKGKCVECGSKKKLEFDHIIPHSKGGANTYRNLQLLCELCNRKKSNKIG